METEDDRKEKEEEGMEEEEENVDEEVGAAWGWDRQ